MNLSISRQIKKMTSRFIFTFYLFGLISAFSGSVLSDENAPPHPPPSPAKQNQDDGSALAPKLEAHSVGEGRISMDFRDALLPEVLKVLSSLSGANFVTSEDAAAKKINIFLENVTFKDALSAIVKGNSLVAQKVGEENIYMVRVGTGEDALIPLETRVFKLKYIRATKVKVLSLAESSSGGSSSGGSSGSSSGGSSGSTSVGSSATVSGGEPAEIKDTVEDLLSPRGKVTVNDRTNSIIVTDTPDRLDQVEKVITILDHPLDQVLIETIILERSVDFNRNLGTEWGGDTGTLSTFKGTTGDSPSGLLKIPSIFQPNEIFSPKSALFDDGNGINFGSFNANQLTSTLKALQSDSRTKILARPKILVLDNEPAFIKITVNAVVGLNQQTSPGTSGGTNIQSLTAERSEIGVTLKVTPLINDDRMITMLLEPRYATADNSAFTISSNTLKDPRIRASRTTLSVEDGKVITISGLLQREETKTKRKVPLLGDIPIFGLFFTKWTTTKTDRELIIFLQPHIVKNGDFGIVKTRSVPDKMTSPDEEAAEFWKIWEKPWYKDARARLRPSRVNDSEQFLESRDKAIEQAFAVQDEKNLKEPQPKSKKNSAASNPKDALIHSELTKDTLASPLPAKPA